MEQASTSFSRRGFAVAGLAATVALGGCGAAAESKPAAPQGPVSEPPAVPEVAGLLAAKGPLAQPRMPETEKAVDTMAKLSFMLGDWQGAGTIYTQKGEQPFTQIESVRLVSAGELMVVEGRGHMPDQPQATMFRALAVLRTEGEKFKWWAASDGAVIDADFQARSDGFDWAVDAGKWQSRYTADISGDTWTHLGEISLDKGKTWNKQLEFEVTRIG